MQVEVRLATAGREEGTYADMESICGANVVGDVLVVARASSPVTEGCACLHGVDRKPGGSLVAAEERSGLAAGLVEVIPRWRSAAQPDQGGLAVLVDLPRTQDRAGVSVVDLAPVTDPSRDDATLDASACTAHDLEDLAAG